MKGEKPRQFRPCLSMGAYGHRHALSGAFSQILVIINLLKHRPTSRRLSYVLARLTLSHLL